LGSSHGDDRGVGSGWIWWGQELKDLEEAYQKGIIAEKQYKEAKGKLIEQRTKK